LEVAREELEAMSCSMMVFLLEAALARLLRALSMESMRPGSRVVVWAEIVSPSSGTEAVSSLLVGSKVGYLPGSPGLVGRVQLLPKLSCAGEGVSGQKGSGGQDGQGPVSDGQTSPSSLALGILKEEDVLRDVRLTLVLLAHLNGEQYHVQRV
jgi:hypothetical protein